MRIDRALQDAKATHAAQFFVIASQHVRWALIDLVRKHLGPEGIGRRHHTGGIGDSPGATLPHSTPSGLLEPEIDPVRLHRAVEQLGHDDHDA